MNPTKGFSSLEVLLSVSILGLIVSALVGAFIFGQQSTQVSGQRAKAVLVAEEGLEAVRNIRNSGFSNLVDGNFGLAIDGFGQWVLSGSSDTVDGFYTRQIIITSTGADRKQIVSTVVWQQNPQRTGNVILTTMMANWQEL